MFNKDELSVMSAIMDKRAELIAVTRAQDASPEQSS